MPKNILTQHCNPTACHAYMLKLFDFVFPNNKLSQFCPIEHTFFFLYCLGPALFGRQWCIRSSLKQSPQGQGRKQFPDKQFSTLWISNPLNNSNTFAFTGPADILHVHMVTFKKTYNIFIWVYPTKVPNTLIRFRWTSCTGTMHQTLITDRGRPKNRYPYTLSVRVSRAKPVDLSIGRRWARETSDESVEWI